MLNKILLFLFCFCLIIIYWFLKSQNNRCGKMMTIIICVVLSLIFAYRELFFPELMGNDYFSYKSWYNYINIETMPFVFKNLGFNLLISFCKILHFDFHEFLFVCSFIINFLNFNYIRKNSKNEIVSFLIYITMFYFSSFNIMRQWISCAIFLNAINYIYEKKKWKYIISISIACLFHDSALILFLLYPILNYKTGKKKKVICIVVIGLLIYLFFEKLVHPILLFSEKIGLGYLSKYENIDSNFETGNLTAFFITILIIILFNFSKKTKEESKLYELLCISAVFNLLKTTNLIFNRLSVYFFPIIILCVPICSNMFNKKSQLIYNIFIILFFLLSMIF